METEKVKKCKKLKKHKIDKQTSVQKFVFKKQTSAQKFGPEIELTNLQAIIRPFGLYIV